MGDLEKSQWRCRDCKKADPRCNGASPLVNKVTTFPQNLTQNSLYDKIAEIERHLRGVSDLREEWDSFKKNHEGKNQNQGLNQISGFEEKLKGFEALKGEVRRIREEIRSLDIRVSSIEQSRVANEIEIHGLPQGNQMDMNTNIVKLAEIAGVGVEGSDIKIQEVRGKQFKKSFLIVRFSDVIKRNEILNGLRTFNKTKNVKEKLNTSHLGGSEACSPIYVNPRLTHPTRRAFQMGKRFQKEGRIARVWLYSSKVFIRRRNEDKPIAVYNCTDLETLVGAVEADEERQKSLNVSILTSPPHDRS
jgi:hypothetical protein